VLEVAAQREDGGERITILPHRLKAIGGVKLSSVQLDADSSQLEAWFINLPPDPAGQELPVNDSQQPLREPAIKSVRPAAYAPETPPSGGIRDVIRAPNLQKFHVGGGLIQMQLVVRGRKFDLEDLTIRGRATIDESRTPEPGQEPLHIAGDGIELRCARRPRRRQVSGQPAEVADAACRSAAVQFTAARIACGSTDPAKPRCPRRASRPFCQRALAACWSWSAAAAAGRPPQKCILSGSSDSTRWTTARFEGEFRPARRRKRPMLRCPAAAVRSD
jgi:hypothetical protein